jgi:enoyl-CoA hydratase
MPAQRALEVGLINEVFSSHEIMVDAVLETAAEIATKSPLAIWGTKESINFTRDHSVADSLNFIATWQAGMYQPQDMANVFEAQSRREEPEFDDLPPARKGLG